MNKDQVLRMLQAIINRLTCMNSEEFEKDLTESGYEAVFDNYLWAKKSKIQTKLTMKVMDLQE